MGEDAATFATFTSDFYFVIGGGETEMTDFPSFPLRAFISSHSFRLFIRG